MAEKLTAEELARLRFEVEHYIKPWPSDVVRLLNEHAELTAELKRARIHALNDASEISTLRAELKHAREELEKLGKGFW